MTVFISILAVLAIVAGIVLGIIARCRKVRAKENSWEYASLTNPKPFWAMAAVGLALLVGINSFTVIPTGYTGVKSVFGQISDNVMPKGFNTKIPFVETIQLVNNKQQVKHISPRIWGDTSEKVQVYGEDTDVYYQIAPGKSAWIYANVTGGPDALISDVDVSAAMKDAMHTFPAEEVTIRSLIEPATAERLNQTLADRYGEGTVTIIMVKINQMDFMDSYNQAIDAKAAAAKEQERAAIENKTNIERAEAEKQVAITKAQAAAEAQKIEAQGNADARLIQVQAEAEANRKIDESVTDTVLRNKFYNVWNGHLPTVMGEGTVITTIAP